MPLSPEQQTALDLVKTGKSVFITGPGGTGKTFLIEKIVEEMKESKVVAVTALTGTAATLLKHLGTRTVHSWANLSIRDIPIESQISRIRRNEDSYERWTLTEILIIDEVSMLSPKMAEDLDLIGKCLRKSSKPFGGIQIVFVGDFFQLPPVLPRCSERQFIFEYTAEDRKTGAIPPFMAVIRSRKQVVVLRKNFRQSGGESGGVFPKILNEIRYGKLTEEAVRIIQSRVKEPPEGEIRPTRILPTRVQVNEINMREMEILDSSSECVFVVKTMIRKEKANENCLDVWFPLGRNVIERMDDEEGISEKYAIEETDKSGQYIPELRLRIGAQVMITSNIDIPRGLVNGTRGVVVKMKADEWVSVKLVNGEVVRVKTRIFDTRHSKVGRSQVPLILAWAITVHKSQGHTIDYAQIDLSSRIFADGQAYVALSRVRSLEGLFITKFVKSSIRANASVLEFAKAISDIS